MKAPSTRTAIAVFLVAVLTAAAVRENPLNADSGQNVATVPIQARLQEPDDGGIHLKLSNGIDTLRVGKLTEEQRQRLHEKQSLPVAGAQIADNSASKTRPMQVAYQPADPQAPLNNAAERMTQAEQQSASPVAPSSPSAPASGSWDKSAGGMIRLDQLERPALEAEARDVFAAKSWYVPPPPPPPVKPAPPPPPSAPPLPFTYLGKIQESPQHLVVFLVQNDRVYAVAKGDVIDNIYRVEGVTAGLLVLTYLPLNIRQTIAVGES